MKNNISDFKTIQNVFQNMPSDEILKIANDIQQQIITDPSLIQMKERKEFVTKADIQIQQLILEYFQNSELRETYIIKAEETLSEKEKKKNMENKNKSWQLLIDPLDGTSAFCRNEETWGVMVGACDLSGNLIASWNLISNGKVYDSFSSESMCLDNFSQIQSKNKTIDIDVYDYGAGASEQFAEIFSKESGYATETFSQTSYPAAVWAGWELFTGKLNAMLWLPSDQGKKWYPDYDLIFLEACQSRGLAVRLGKINEQNAMVVVAPSEKDLDILWNVGLEMIPKNISLQVKTSSNPVQITDKVL